MDLTTLRIDGLDVQVPKQWAQVLEKGITTRDEAIAALTKQREQLQAKCDGAAKDLTDAQAKLAAAEDPKRLDAAVNARATLLEQARRVLPAEHKFEGESPRKIHEAVLKRLDDKLDLTGRSDEYVSARFDHAIAGLGTDTGGSIRIPSAACGLVGLKPSLGEVPTGGIVPLSKTMDHVGPLCATVEDARGILEPMLRSIVAVGSDDEQSARELAPPWARISALGRMQRPPLDGPVDLRED